MFKIIKPFVAFMLLSISLLISTQGHSALIQGGNFFTDTNTGLDWLSLSETAGDAYNSAETNNIGWRYATNGEVEGIFAEFFNGFYATNADGTSISDQTPYANQTADILRFNSYFGESGNTNYAGDVNQIRSFGLYIDELGGLRYMGTYQSSELGVDVLNAILGVDLTVNPLVESTKDSFGTSFSTFLVRDTASSVPEVPSVMLLVMGLLGLLLSKSIFNRK